MINFIEELINNGENITTEFKKAKNKLPSDLFTTICAFLNRYGGNILLGVSDNGKILGIDENAITQMKKDFSNLCNNPEKIFPIVHLVINDYVIDGKTILHITVPVSSEVYRSANKIYDRNEDGDYDITNSTLLVSNMYIRKKDFYLEEKVFPSVTINDLNVDAFEKVRKLVAIKNNEHPWLSMSNEEILHSSSLYGKDNETNKKGLTLAAILLFGKDETIVSCLPTFKTDAIYRNEDMDRYDDRDIIITNLIDSYYRLMEFVKKHTNDKFYLEGTQVIKVRDIIAREICVNLLIHRELSDGITSRMIITKDSIYTENPSKPRFSGVLNLNNYVPYSKNPKIAKVFREIGLADELGSGIRKLTQYSKVFSKYDPILEEGDIFRTTIFLNNELKTVLNETETLYVKGKKYVSEEQILAFCRSPKSLKEITKYFGYKNVRGFRENYINDLLKQNKLKYTIPNKPKSGNQKYVSN